MEDDEDPPSLSFHALTASTMLMPWLILSLRKRLYSLCLRFSLLTSARRDFGIPTVFGMVSGVLDEKKSIPDAHKLSDYGRSSPRNRPAMLGALRATDCRRSPGRAWRPKSMENCRNRV